ncbi:MAG: hypothetical protein WC364_14900 [Eubacteriales bacterium]
MNAKIHTLKGEWLKGDFATQVLPVLCSNNIGTLSEEKLYLTHIFQDAYRAKILTLSPFIGVLDPCHWYYDDALFTNYIQAVASLHLPAICVFESPFGIEKPPINIHDFERKLYKRTEIAYAILKQLSPTTTVISPPISIVAPEFQDMYLDYFIHNRAYFDVYGLHCVYELQEMTIGLITSFLLQVLTTLDKPVWITRWAVPACEYSTSDRSIATCLWKPVNYAVASAMLRTGFRIIEKITTNTKWFFVGIGKDDYDPNKAAPDMWDKFTLPSISVSNWGYQHFLGIIDNQNKLKQPILDEFLSIVNNHGESR